MESGAERESQERKVGPTVSKDKWINHAVNKLSRGYVLIVGTEKKTANFHSKEKGYEMCAYNVARQLIRDGLVHKTRDHHLGEVYELIAAAPAPVKAAAAKKAVVEEEFDILLQELEKGNADESETAAPLT